MSEPLRHVSPQGPDDDPRHARAEERRRLHARRENALRSLLELGGELSVSLDLYQTVDLLLFNLMGQLSTARSAVWLVPEEEGGRSVLVRSHGFHRPTIEAIGVTTGWLREHFRDDPSPMLAWALQERVGAAEFELMRHAEIALFASLHMGREQLGWLAIGARVDGSQYTPEDLQALEATLGIAAVSMHSARLYNRAREANRQLRATNDHLSELDRLKTEFLSNVNHELRTPLAIVLASLDLAVSEGASGPQLQALLAGSLHQSKKLHALIENLLTFADIQHARLALEIVADDPTAVLEQCMAERLPGVTEGLRERILASRPARIINTASAAHQDATLILDFDDLQSAKNYRALKAYSRSKLCNILFTRELARRLHGAGVTANCLHPGFVATRFGDQSGGPIAHVVWLAKFFAISPAKGAETIVYLASSSDVAATAGQYFYKCLPTTPSAPARDDRSALLLWQRSAALAGMRENGA